MSNEFLKNHYGKLKGATITDVQIEEDDEGSWPLLEAKLADGSRAALIVMRDPEGNGPGHIHIEPLKGG